MVEDTEKRHKDATTECERLRKDATSECERMANELERLHDVQRRNAEANAEIERLRIEADKQRLELQQQQAVHEELRSSHVRTKAAHEELQFSHARAEDEASKAVEKSKTHVCELEKEVELRKMQMNTLRTEERAERSDRRKILDVSAKICNTIDRCWKRSD